MSMKPIIKTLPLGSTTITKTTREDYISNIIPEEFDKYTDTIEPPFNTTGLTNLRYSSIYHRKCLKAVAVDVTMTGWTVNNTTDNKDSTNKERLETLFNDYSFETSFFKALEDYRTYGYAAVEINKDNQGNVMGFSHIRSPTIRMCKGGEKAVQKVGSTTRYFKICGVRSDDYLDSETGNWSTQQSATIPEVLTPRDEATEIIWISDSSPDSDYYGEPDYISASLTILSDEYLREYNNNTFITNGIANYFITVTGNFDEEEDEDGNTFSESLEEQILDLQNKPGTAVVFTIPTNDPDSKIDVQVTRISDEQKEASFEKFRESNMQEILAAHEVPPQRLGINISGPLAGSIAVEVNKQYNDKTIRPLQRKIEQLINTLVVEGLMQITDCKFQYRGLDTRDVPGELEIALELFRAGAMKPIELREQFGDIFHLAMDIMDHPIIEYNPELDEFYLNGQPLGMADMPPDQADQVEEIMKSIDNGITQLITS